MRQADEIRIDREICQVCGECVEACPGGALEMLGRAVSIEGLADELEKDRTFFDQSSGGVTLSGGEPLRQPQFALALLEELHRRGIQTALDTCCVCDTQVFENAVKLADVLLLDLKIMDANAHRFHTGADNEIILRNIQAAADLVRRNPDKRLWVRTPLIPDATATQKNLEHIGIFIRENIADVLERWELCTFNNLCRDKYKRLNMTWAYEHSELITADELAVYAGWAAASGIDARLVLPTGATRLAQTTIESGGEK